MHNFQSDKKSEIEVMCFFTPSCVHNFQSDKRSEIEVRCFLIELDIVLDLHGHVLCGL